MPSQNLPVASRSWRLQRRGWCRDLVRAACPCALAIGGSKDGAPPPPPTRCAVASKLTAADHPSVGRTPPTRYPRGTPIGPALPSSSSHMAHHRLSSPDLAAARCRRHGSHEHSGVCDVPPCRRLPLPPPPLALGPPWGPPDGSAVHRTACSTSAPPCGASARQLRAPTPLAPSHHCRRRELHVPSPARPLAATLLAHVEPSALSHLPHPQRVAKGALPLSCTPT